MAEAAKATERSFRMPHTLVIVGSLVVLVLLLSWLVPSGTYQRIDRDGRQVTIPGTYQQVEKVYLGPQWLMIAPIKGFLDGSLIIAFLLLIGGAFNVIQATGTIEFAITRLTTGLAARPTLEKLMIPVMMIIFSLGGSVFGMAEETIPFILIFVPLALSLGYDSIVGVSIPFLGAAAGFQQPQVPTIPGFYLTGELLATYITNQATNETMVLDEVRVTQSDDYLIDDFVGLLVLNQSRKRYGVSVNAGGAVRSLWLRHIPVTASDVTNVFVTNGATATITPSNILYVYVGGRISGEGVTASYRSESELETNVIPTPQNKTPLAGTVQPYAGAGAPMGGPVGSAPGWRGQTGTQGGQFGPLTGRRSG